MDAATATLIGVGITAFVSVCAIGVNYLITKQTLRHGAARDIGKISLELKIQQLNELYGPLLLLVEQNRRLAQKLREGKPDPENWRLLDNLPEVLENPQDKAIVDAIMEIDGKIENLIINKGGLVRSPGPPESFNLFLGHYKILKLAVEGKERPKVAEFEYYPKRLNDDVKEAYEAIKHEIDDMLRRYERLLTE
jgi:hypothetical protein